MRFDQPSNESSSHPKTSGDRVDDSDDRLDESTKTKQAPPPQLKLRSRRVYPVIVNRQLLLMILLLIGVLFAMFEAGKPERWHWLIPPTESDELSLPMMQIEPSRKKSNLEFNRDSVAGNPLDRPTQIDSINSTQHDSSTEEKPSRLDKTFQLVDIEGEYDSPVSASGENRENAEASYPQAALEFWQNWLRRSSSQERNELYFILKRIRHQQPCPQLQLEPLSELIDQISRQREADHEQRFEKLSFTPSSQRQQLTNDLFESQQVWQLFELPALQAFANEAETTEPQRQQLEKLQLALDATFYRFVKDQTAQGWEGDSPAWGRIWELNLSRLPDQATLAQPIPVTHLELTSQPSFYRGKPVRASGRVQAAIREPLTVRELGIEQLYVLVVNPSDSNVSPYFVYTRQLPEGFPGVTDQYVKMNIPIELEGRFFKIRTYPDTQNKVQNAPMILAYLIRPLDEDVAPLSTSVGSENFAKPLATGLILLPLLAILVAWWLFRITNIVRFRPGKNRTAQIHRNLDDLSQNPDIKTDRERIDELYQ